MSIATRIKQRRMQCGISRPTLAKACHVHLNTIENWERGRSRPDDRNLYLLANALNASTAWLRLGGVAPGEPQQIKPVLVSDVSFASFLDAQIGDLERRLNAARAARWRLTA